MTPKLKKIILTILVLVILFIVYAIFIKDDPVNTTLIDGKVSSTRTLEQEDAQALGNQIAQALLRIEQITLDKAIFNDEIYQSLQDRSQPITDEPIGRANPFAPLGDTSSVTSTIRSTSTLNATTTSKTTSTTTSTVKPTTQ